MHQALSNNARRLCRVLKSPNYPFFAGIESTSQCRRRSIFTVSSNFPLFSDSRQSTLTVPRNPVSLTIPRACFSSEVNSTQNVATEIAKETYDKIINSINEKRSAPPNSWIWSLIESCKNQEDIKLLFDALQNLRRFRLSNLRIHDNFNCNLCREVAKACARVGALDYGKKTLWKHNLFGLTPSIASAHHLLSYAKAHNDVKLMEQVMKLLKPNNLPLQPGTADFVFSICYNANDWQLLSKYSKKFVKAGVKLRQTAFDAWMEFAAKTGDTESLWRAETLRSETIKRHTLASGFSCVKGLLLEQKPAEAAAVIEVLNQALPDTKRPGIVIELQKLVSEWPMEVVKHQKEEDKKALIESLRNDIPVMVTSLLNKGLDVSINLEDLTSKQGSSA